MINQLVLVIGPLVNLILGDLDARVIYYVSLVVPPQMSDACQQYTYLK